MRLSFSNERILSVMAHPDDAELLCAGTLARAQGEGASVGIAVMCRGDKGTRSIAASAPGDLAEIRHREAAAAAHLIGASLHWLDREDGALFDSSENRRDLIEVLRQFRPTLVIAHCSRDYHPDHRAASALAQAASWFCASRGHQTASPALDHPPGLWFADTLEMLGFIPHFFIDISKHFEVKKQMLACHDSQLQRGADGDFMPLGELMARQGAARGAQAGVAVAEAFRWDHALKRTGAF